MLCLNISPNEGYLVFYKRGEDGKPILDERSVSVLCVDNLTGRRNDSQVQVNYEGPLRVARSESLERDYFKGLEPFANKLARKIDEPNPIDMIEGGIPLIIFQRGFKGPMFDKASISMISLGREFGRFGDRVLEVRYIGILKPYSYEEVLSNPELAGGIENVLQVYKGMRDGLLLRQIRAKELKKGKRSAA